MTAEDKNSDISVRERELIGLFKSKDFILSANRLDDFVTDFGSSREWRQDSISYCARAHMIQDMEKRKKIGADEFLKKVTELLYDMMDLLDSVIKQLTQAQAA